MYDMRTNIIKCPNCGKSIENHVEGDLDSGWQQDGSYEMGVITIGYECPYCGDADADVFIHD